MVVARIRNGKFFMAPTYVGRYVSRGSKCVGGITCAHAQSQFWAVNSLINENVKQTDLQRLKNRGKKG